MNLGTKRLRGRPRNRWQDEVREDGRIVGGEGWQEKVHNREEWKKLLTTAKNCRFLHMPMEWINANSLHSTKLPHETFSPQSQICVMVCLICVIFAFQGSFYLLLYGMALSFAVFVSELLRYRRLKLKITMQSIFKSSKGIWKINSPKTLVKYCINVPLGFIGSRTSV